MAVVSPVFLDTTVLLEGLIDLGPQSEKARAILEAVVAGRIRGARTAWNCCLEFFAVATRLPEEYRLAPADACRLIEEVVLEHLRVHELPGADRRTFLAAAGRDRVVGGRVYDAHIAEIARIHGAKTVITGNQRHFRGLSSHGIRVAAPADVDLVR
jgi:predicted nucleic acid-binding protein